MLRVYDDEGLKPKEIVYFDDRQWGDVGYNQALEDIKKISKPIEKSELKSFILSNFGSSSFCGCYEGDLDNNWEDGVEFLVEAILKELRSK